MDRPFCDNSGAAKNNTFKLQNMEGEEVFDGPINA